MSNEETTTEIIEIIEMITAAGMDYHNFQCGIIAKRVAWDREHGYEVNVWEEIAEFPTCYYGGDPVDRAESDRAWEMAGLPDPLAWEEEAA